MFTADYTRLVSLFNTYTDFYNDHLNTDEYTETSMARLKTMLDETQAMLNAATADQKDADAMAANLREAYEGLVKIEGLSTMSISVPTQDNVTVVNDGYARYSSLSVNGAEIGLRASVPSNVTASINFTWSVTGNDLTVNSSGVVTHSAATDSCGVVTVVATDELGNTARASINVSFVRIPVTAISFDDYDDNIVYGAPNTTSVIVPKLTGSTVGTGSRIYDPSITECTYTSADPEIASVDNNGVISFVSFGETTITATTRDGGLQQQSVPSLQTTRLPCASSLPIMQPWIIWNMNMITVWRSRMRMMPLRL